MRGFCEGVLMGIKNIPATMWRGFFLLMYAPMSGEVWPDAAEKKTAPNRGRKNLEKK